MDRVLLAEALGQYEIGAPRAMEQLLAEFGDIVAVAAVPQPVRRPADGAGRHLDH